MHKTACIQISVFCYSVTDLGHIEWLLLYGTSGPAETPGSGRSLALSKESCMLAATSSIAHLHLRANSKGSVGEQAAAFGHPALCFRRRYRLCFLGTAMLPVSSSVISAPILATSTGAGRR